jgi:hypothetical protein
MKYIRATFRWITERLKDLFYGPGNTKLDNGRVAALIALCMMVAGVWHNVRLEQAIDLGPAGLGGGLAAVLAALETYLFFDRRLRKGE